MPPLSTEALWWLALPLLFLAPFPVFVQMQKKTDLLAQKVKEKALGNRLTALTIELDMKFGSTSSLSRNLRLEGAIAYFESLEREVAANDFTNAYKVLAVKEVLLSNLRGWYASGVRFHEWNERIFKTVEAIRLHEEEQAEAAQEED